MKLWNYISVGIAGAALLSCSKTTMSERDLHREQLRNTADAKRRELQVVTGEYRGSLEQESGAVQRATLKLEIKDIPTPVEGQVDPVPMPTLTGYLRLNLGAGEDSSEYVGFALQKADYDPKRERVDLVVVNDSYKEVIFGLDRATGTLKGSWTAPSVAARGTAQFQLGGAAPTPLEELRGEYAGVLLRDSEGAYQFGHLTLQTNFQPPDGLKVSAILRVIAGSWTSTEYLTYRYDNVAFNPITGQIALKQDQADVTFQGQVFPAGLKGQWGSSHTGKLGAASFEKGTKAPKGPSQAALFESLRGTYRGKLKKTHPDVNLPENVQASFVTSQDLSQPGGIKVTGSLRFYFGDFDSLEYMERRFVSIQYNLFNRKLVAKTDEDGITLKADLDLLLLKGSLFSDALGEMATVEVTKE